MKAPSTMEIEIVVLPKISPSHRAQTIPCTVDDGTGDDTQGTATDFDIGGVGLGEASQQAALV